MNKFEVVFYPYGNKQIGSSRVRVYKLDKYLNELGIHTCIINNYEFLKKLNSIQDIFVLNLLDKRILRNYIINKLSNKEISISNKIFFFQKRGYNDLNLIKYIKEKNGKIVFDIVDEYDNKYINVIKNSNIVTTASEPMRIFLESKFENMDVKVIDQYIDYIDKPYPNRMHEKYDDLKIVFFSNPRNLQDISLCLEPLKKLAKKKKYFFSYICGERHDDIFKGLKVNYIKWEYHTYSSNLKKFDLAIAPQSDNLKPRSKVVEAITHNLPIISSNIHSYRELAKNTNTTEFICNNQKEWYYALDTMLDPETRNEYLRKTQQWVWKYHGKKFLTNKWLSMFNELF